MFSKWKYKCIPSFYMLTHSAENLVPLSETTILGVSQKIFLCQRKNVSVPDSLFCQRQSVFVTDSLYMSKKNNLYQSVSLLNNPLYDLSMRFQDKLCRPLPPPPPRSGGVLYVQHPIPIIKIPHTGDKASLDRCG